MTHLFSGKLTFRFTQDATPALVQELVRAITYVNTKSALPYGQEVVTWTLTDAGQRETKVTSFIQFANNAPTDISLSATQVAKSAASGTLVTKITGTDPNIGDSRPIHCSTAPALLSESTRRASWSWSTAAGSVLWAPPTP